jgi:hypothetical protein
MFAIITGLLELFKKLRFYSRNTVSQALENTGNWPGGKSTN